MKRATVALLSALLFSCNSTSTTGVANAPITLAALQQAWQLISIDGNALQINSHLKVDLQANASGKLACNKFFGIMELQANQLRIDKIGTTRKSCLAEANTLDSAISSTLANWSTVQMKEKELILTGDRHTLIYQRK